MVTVVSPPRVRVEKKAAPTALYPILFTSIPEHLFLRDKVLGGDSSLDGAPSFIKASAGASHC